MSKKTGLLKAFRYVGLLGIVLSGLIAIVGTGGGRSHGRYLVNAKLIHKTPPPATASPSAPDIFDLSVISSGASITFHVSFTDIEGDVTTFCVAFEDQPKKYYAYDVKDETYGETSYRLSVTDLINMTTLGTYCFTVFVQDEAGNTSNKLRFCFLVECEPCEDECYSRCDDGTMTITGTLDGDLIDLSGYACARKDDDIVVGLFFCDGTYLDLIIKEPDKLASGTTLAVKPYDGDDLTTDDFPIVVERYNPEHWRQSASGGTFTVTTYNANGLNATYELIMPDGGVLSGEINIWRFNDFDRET